ncbi:MAG: ABC transporter substrate-binding protein [Thermomicrobiales bacterium]
MTRPTLVTRRSIVRAGGIAAIMPFAGAALFPAQARQSNAPTGEVIISESALLDSLDVLAGSPQLDYGMLECLTRTTGSNELVPWLAESFSNPTPETWRFTLRDARFWDGTPVTAKAIIDAFTQANEAHPENLGLIGPETTITAVDDRTLEFTSAGHDALLPYLLSLPNFVVFRKGQDGAATVFTGPYRPVKFVVDTSLELEAFTDHWAGPPPLAKITFKPISDPNARLLALQSGEVDLLFSFPPEFVQILGTGFDVPVVPSGRIEMLSLNLQRPIFADVAVRQAFSLGIDRDTLNLVGLDGQGEAARSLFPSTTGYPTVDFLKQDTTQAASLLDAAGWVAGTDGVRAKGDQRLSFTIHATTVRAEQVPVSVSIQNQLQALGFEIQVKEVKSINDTLASGDWDAVMKANNTIASGSPIFEYNRLLLPGGGDNVNGYDNPKLTDLVAQMRKESDAGKRDDLSRQIQTIFSEDLPVVPLLALPITIAYRSDKIAPIDTNPNDYYLVTTDLKLA